MSRAVFTIVKDEDYYLSIWLKYYSKYFDKKDIYILNNGKKINLDYNIIDVKSEYSFDVSFLLKTVQDFQCKLLENYKLVLFAECDEIIYPKRGNYEDHILNNDAVKCFGYDILHTKDEPTINWNLYPLLNQRKWWIKNTMLNKQLLTTIPLKYEPGFHKAIPEAKIDDALILIHLRKIDYHYTLDRRKSRMAWKRPPKQACSTVYQWHPNNFDKFDAWFYGGVENKELIPEEFKHVC